MINKTSLKFIAVFVAIVAISLISLYILQTYFSPERQAARRLAELERLYAEDTYGGQTPEETLQLFIDALKAGDIELASRYFLPEDREEINGDLVAARQAGQLEDVISRVMALKSHGIKDDSVIFTSVGEDNIVEFQATLGKNQGGVWKFIDL
ncbi:MAG: hypothetical protein HYS44_03220 [Candidatus Niyogibacteria bacterium]|nr:hypothetical protein [Candidatus Niyogibacteria bacterium]